MEPWGHDHIHEKADEDPHRFARYIVGASLIWVTVLMGTVAVCSEVKSRAKSVKQRLSGYNKNRRNSE